MKKVYVVNVVRVYTMNGEIKVCVYNADVCETREFAERLQQVFQQNFIDSPELGHYEFHISESEVNPW